MRFQKTDKISNRVLALAVLIFIELVFGFYLYYGGTDRVHQAYIVKNGASYILLWKGKGNETLAKHYSYLFQALQFANDELGLGLGPNPNFGSSVETVWSRDDLGKRMVFWTIENTQNLNRLTFNRPFEAEIYQAAFRRGAYTASPFGHSLSLVPKK